MIIQRPMKTDSQKGRTLAHVRETNDVMKAQARLARRHCHLGTRRTQLQQVELQRMSMLCCFYVCKAAILMASLFQSEDLNSPQQDAISASASDVG